MIRVRIERRCVECRNDSLMARAPLHSPRSGVYSIDGETLPLWQQRIVMPVTAQARAHVALSLLESQSDEFSV